MDTWHHEGHISNLTIKLERKIKLKSKEKRKEKKKETEAREREGEKEREEKSSSFSLRSTKFRPSEFVGPRTKFHLLNKTYAWIPKSRDFAQDSSKEFGKSKVSGLGSVHKTSYIFFYAPRGRDSSYFGLFSILGAVWLSFNALRGCLAN